MATLVFGLDGANWPLIEPWLEVGHLPNIDRLRKEGLWGISESVLPPVTCPNWKCYATSRSPGAHDVYWWEQVDRDSPDIDVPDSRSFTAPELWDYLNDEGLDAGVINLPMSYPPRELRQFMIAGGPRSREADYTYPAELESEIERRFGYRVHPENVVTSSEDRSGVEATLGIIETRFETAEALLDETDLDFLHLTIFHLNVLQHYFWNGPPVERAWKLIDDWLRSFLDEGHTIVLMSDHGCAEIQDVFHVNEWLQEEGYLAMETSAGDYLMKAGLTQERLAGLVRSVGLESRIRKYVPRRLIERFPDEEGIKRDNKFDKMVREDTDAIASGQGLIYVLHDPGSTRYEEVVTELVEKLDRLQTPRGSPLATAVHRGDELYPEGDPRFRPDLIFEQGPGVHTSGAVGKNAVFTSTGRWDAENIPEGLFLAYGPNVAAEGDIGAISILDIAPTVLHAMGQDLPEDFEGDPVQATHTDRHEVTYRSPLPARGSTAADSSQEVTERLADLGYLE
jgi:predicted AlkP superfamily phosphohydrolase/phosphomutase